jgi:hypothetical protein
MLILSIGFLYWYMRMTRRERAFATITGKGFRPRRIRLGRWGLPVAAIALLILAIGVVVPLLVLLWASFLRFFQPPSLAAIQSMKLVNYQRLLMSDAARWAFWNSLILGVASDRPRGTEVRRGEPLGRALGPIGVELRRDGVPISPAFIAASSVPLSNGGNSR